VLFPLRGPDDRAAAAADLERAAPDLALREVTLSFAELVDLGPISVPHPAPR
jgi:hypothetical protein